jgi:hypothetical protein
MHYWTVNLSLPTEAFRAVGGFYEGYRTWGGEDVELGIRLARHGLRPVMTREAWAIEYPHARDPVANDASNQKNSWILWERHPEPATELYGGIYGKGDWDPPLEVEYRKLLDWAGTARSTDVQEEVRASCEAVLAEHDRPVRVAVLGCGDPRALIGLSAPVSWTFVDFDRDLLALGEGEHGHRLLHAVGLRLDAPTDTYDLVVVSSRLRGLWPRWGVDIMAEAQRVGRTVAVPFQSTVAAHAPR